MKLKEVLQKELSEKELSCLKASFDIMGSIAILEIPKELVKKEKIIADAVMKLSPNIKIVVKKSGQRHGDLRLQKYKILAGEKTKETTHTESGVRINLDIENVYYSVRLSTERLRISQQIKPEEQVLVMFSGCAPYPCVLAKNSKAKMIYGIELNKEGHKYGLENIRLNRLNNVFLAQGDVKKITPDLARHIIGLKCSTDSRRINRILKEKPEIIELFLEFEECTETNNVNNKLEKTIQKLMKKGIEIVLHAPWNEKGKSASLAVLDRQQAGRNLFMLSNLGRLAKKYNLKVVVHPANDGEISQENKKAMLENFPKLQEYYRYFYFENICRSCFKSFEDIKETVEKFRIKNICIDTCHLYEDFLDNNKIKQIIQEIYHLPVNLYFHLADADGKTHAMETGRGKIDFNAIIPFLTTGIAEINCKDYNNPAEMIRSRAKLAEIGKRIKKFDRILMPLPKGAESFLGTALNAVKKNGIIHFYDFAHENEMPESSFAKIEKACKEYSKPGSKLGSINTGIKYKILQWNKCGNYAPGKYRLCVDFQVLG